MDTVRRHHRFASWLALLAMAALVLLPTLSHALAKGGNGFAEICTPQGLKVVPLDDSGSAPATLQLEHCAYCALGAGPLAPPPAAAALALPPAGGAAVPVLFLHAPHTLHAWAAPRPRGPPASLA